MSARVTAARPACREPDRSDVRPCPKIGRVASEQAGPKDLRELFRYRKAGRIRTYRVRPLPDERIELWVVSANGREGTKSRKLVSFDDEELLDAFLEDLKRELRLGGWSES